MHDDLYLVDIIWPRETGKRFSYVYQSFQALRDFVRGHLKWHLDNDATVTIEHRYTEYSTGEYVWEKIDHNDLEPIYKNGHIIEARYTDSVMIRI